jgi:peptide chain release factor 1
MTLDLEQIKNNPRTQFFASELERLKAKITETQELLKDEGMRDMAQDELDTLQQQKDGVEQQIADILEKEKEEEKFPNEIILEVRAGAGGDEASLFAREVAEMYERYAEATGWQWSLQDESANDVGGYKEVSIQIKGQDVYKRLRFETGIHRVQRVPSTEKQGRIHTSTASVVIMPIRKNIKFKLDETEL